MTSPARRVASGGGAIRTVVLIDVLVDFWSISACQLWQSGRRASKRGRPSGPALRTGAPRSVGWSWAALALRLAALRASAFLGRGVGEPLPTSRLRNEVGRLLQAPGRGQDVSHKLWFCQRSARPSETRRRRYSRPSEEDLPRRRMAEEPKRACRKPVGPRLQDHDEVALLGPRQIHAVRQQIERGAEGTYDGRDLPSRAANPVADQHRIVLAKNLAEVAGRGEMVVQA